MILQKSSKFKIVSMVTWKIGIVDFGASFGPEWLALCWQNQLQS